MSDEMRRWKIKEILHFEVEMCIAEDGVMEGYRLLRKWNTRSKMQEWSPRMTDEELGWAPKKNKAPVKKKVTKDIDVEESEEVML